MQQNQQHKKEIDRLIAVLKTTPSQPKFLSESKPELQSMVLPNLQKLSGSIPQQQHIQQFLPPQQIQKEQRPPQPQQQLPVTFMQQIKLQQQQTPAIISQQQPIKPFDINQLKTPTGQSTFHQIKFPQIPLSNMQNNLNANFSPFGSSLQSMINSPQTQPQQPKSIDMNIFKPKPGS